MNVQRWMAFAGMAALLASGAAGKDKKKATLPAVVLNAKTVLVVVLPDSGAPMDDLNANRNAQQEVEKALMKWGRYRLAVDAQTADLVIAVRKGTGKAATPTINGGGVNNRPVFVESTDGQVRGGGARGQAPPLSQDSSADDGPAHPGMAVGGQDDVFKVYLGGGEYPLDAAPLWSYTGKDGLRPPDVAAVEAFRKALDGALKAQQQQQQQQQPAPAKNP